ncbi:hypothetical protein RQP46_008536 [Phenoliferia psychrophenolica]
MNDPRSEEDVVPVAFDEGVLRNLCDLDCGMPLLLDRMKQGMASCREASMFLKKRAVIEEEYARSMIKLARSSSESYGLSEGKSGSFVQSWVSLLRTHELLGDNRLKFASQLNEMGEELIGITKEVDKNRKATKDLGTRLERGLAEQESLVDKARTRFDASAEELERLLLVKQGESLKDPIAPYTSGGGIGGGGGGGGAPNKRTFGKAISKLKGPKSVAQVARQEEDVRSRMGQSSDSYRAQVIGAQTVRQEYFSLQLPRILRSLKESVDELDLGTQYHLSRYAFLFESTLVTDGLTISPVSSEDGPGIKAVVDQINLNEDFKTFMNQFALSWQLSGQRGPKRDSETLASRPALSPRPSTSNFSATHAAQSFSTAQSFPPPTRPTFAIDLGEQMHRDGVEVPRILEKCCEAIELHGLDSMGIYRLSGTTSRVQRLKGKLDRDIEGTDLLSEENLTDINDIAAVMKLWFREMPEPLLTWELYHGFIEAAKIENDRLRHIRLHERVNELPDPNYATLKYLMGHLDKVKSREHANQMSGSNLAIVFGPNLLGAPPNANPGAGPGSALADMSWQCKCVETILQHYVEIFVAPPPRDLGGLTASEGSALRRLADVRGLGSAWSQLAATATLREQFVAHQADLDLIYAPARQVDCFVPGDYTKYSLYATGDPPAHGELLDKQKSVSRQWDAATFLEGKWKAMNVGERERTFLRAIDDFVDMDKWLWLLLCPELSLLLAEGDGSAFGDLMRRVTYDPRNPPGKELKRVPHVKFDRYFDMDGKSEATIPKPRGVRGYQMFVQHSRLMCLIRVLSGMINNLAGQRTRQVPTREAKAMPQAFLDLQYQSMKITMTKKLGSEKEALEAMKSMGINNAADCVKALDQFAGFERVHRCENCLRKAPADGTFAKCSKCGKAGLEHRYCGLVCQKADWPAHKKACGKSDEQVMPIF